MSAAQRNKGAAGERELFRLLARDLGVDIKRNLSQTRGGGADSLDLPHIAIEVKRQERLALTAWWRQTVEQAGMRVPILFYRASRQPWRAVVPLRWIDGDVFSNGETAIVDYDTALVFIRATVAGLGSFLDFPLAGNRDRDLALGSSGRT